MIRRVETPNERLKLAVIGAGYVGLVTAACLAELGHQVCCIDRASTRIDSLRRGTMPFHEPGLEETVGAVVETGRLRFATELAVSHGTAAALVAG